MNNTTTQPKKPGYVKRGEMPEGFMKALQCFKHIVDIAKEPNSELDLQYRGGKVNIYYLGGSLLRLEGEEGIFFDEKYFYTPNKNGMRSSDIEKLRSNDYKKRAQKSKAYKDATQDELDKAHKEALSLYSDLVDQRDAVVGRLKIATTRGEVSAVLEDMKEKIRNWKQCLVDNGWLKVVKGERSVQHYISLYNKCFDDDTDFVVLDIEYAVSSESDYKKKDVNGMATKEQPRADILAVDREGQLYVFELKYGMKSVGKSVKEKSSALAHIEDFLQTMGGKMWDKFLTDINTLFQTKKSEHLLDEDVKLDMQKPPRFAFVMKCAMDTDERDFKEHLEVNGVTGIDTIYLPRDNEGEEYPKAKYKLSKRHLCK